MDYRPLGHTGLSVSHVGWGTVKLGRNAGVKYPSHSEVPDTAEATRIVHAMLDLGITLLDTAPAYGDAQEKLGEALRGRRDDVVLCTKVGESFDGHHSHHDFSADAARQSLEASLRSLRTDSVDVVLIHSDGRDLEIQHQTDLVETLQVLRAQGLTRAIGLSGKTPEGARAAISWADVLMCPYSSADTEHETVIAEAAEAGLGILLKKVLGSGHLPPDAALTYAASESPIASAIDSMVIGSLSPVRMAHNIAVTE